MGIFDNHQTIKPEEVKINEENYFNNIDDIKKSRGVKILGYGRPATGKTHFALTALGVIYFMDTERSVTLLRSKFPDKKIFVLEVYETKPESGERDDVASYERILSAVNNLYLKNVEDCIIVIDSISDLWKLSQNYAKIKIFKKKPSERLNQQWDWGVINDLYNDIIKKLLHLNCDVILLARASQEYSGPGQAIDEWSPNCQKDTEYLMDVVLYFKKILKNKQPIFIVEIQKCRQKGEVIGQEYENLDMGKLKEILK
jgi:hypothetical protein